MCYTTTDSNLSLGPNFLTYKGWGVTETTNKSYLGPVTRVFSGERLRWDKEKTMVSINDSSIGYEQISTVKT